MGCQVNINTILQITHMNCFYYRNSAMVWPNVLFSHKHIIYLETTELVIGTLVKRRVDASQIWNKFLQFHIAYTKVDKI